jgi:solute carrier family 35 protein F5
VFSAFYVILLKVKVRQESRIDMQLFFGSAGLFSILFLWPLGVVLHLTGAEKFESPSGPRIIVGLLVNVSVG